MKKKVLRAIVLLTYLTTLLMILSPVIAIADSQSTPVNFLLIEQLWRPEFWHPFNDSNVMVTDSKLKLRQDPENTSKIIYEGNIEVDPRNGRIMNWNPGAEHTLIGTIVIETDHGAFIFESDSNNPLVFTVGGKIGGVYKDAYIYQKGTGAVTFPDGKKVRLTDK